MVTGMQSDHKSTSEMLIFSTVKIKQSASSAFHFSSVAPSSNSLLFSNHNTVPFASLGRKCTSEGEVEQVFVFEMDSCMETPSRQTHASAWTDGVLYSDLYVIEL